MSLINDALKRAKQAHTENPPPTPDMPLRPAEAAPHQNSKFPVLPLALIAMALVLGVGLIILALQTWDAAPQIVQANEQETTSPAQVAAPPATLTPAVAPIDSSSEATAAVPAAPPEPPKPVLPKLQGIFYSPSRPSAVVNGKTVYIGSRVGEARDFVVLEIGRDSVTVASGSQTNLLVLEE
jgi:hypothetical protein